MSLKDDLAEAANIEVMRRVREPIDDDIPDPEINFRGVRQGTRGADREYDEAATASRKT